MFKKIILVSFFLIIGLWSCSPALVYGQGIIPPETAKSSCPPGYEGNCGDYQLNDVIVLGIKVSSWILGFVGSLTLLMFIYGGFIFLISAGSADKIGEAKKIIIAAVVGLLIVFGSFLIIKFVLKSMGIEWNGQQIDITKIKTNT